MTKKIEQINQSVADKRNRLKEKVSRSFEAITLPTTPAVSRREIEVSASKTPGLTYVLYVVAAIFVIIGICADDSSFWYFLMAVICAIGGYMFSKRGTAQSVVAASSPSIDINSLKTTTISKGIDSVKNITREWEDFMELAQKEMFAAIDSSSFSESQKDCLSSKIFSYEVIDINLSDLMSMINSANSVSEIQQNICGFKSKFLDAIDLAADNQMKKYRSLVDAA